MANCRLERTRSTLQFQINGKEFHDRNSRTHRHQVQLPEAQSASGSFCFLSASFKWEIKLLMIKLYDGPYQLISTSALHPTHSERKEEIPRNIRHLFFPILPNKGSLLRTFTKNQGNKSPAVGYKESRGCDLYENREPTQSKQSVIWAICRFKALLLLYICSTPHISRLKTPMFLWKVPVFLKKAPYFISQTWVNYVLTSYITKQAPKPIHKSSTKTKHIPENSRNTQKAHYYSPIYRATRTHN